MRVKVIGNYLHGDPLRLRPFFPESSKNIQFFFSEEGKDFKTHDVTLLPVSSGSEYSSFKIKNAKDLKKTVIYTNSDNPSLFENSLNDGPLFLIAQPTKKIEHPNFICIPLLMTDHWPIIEQDPQWLKSLKDIRKKNDFSFTGQTKYGNREIYKDLKIDNYIFKETNSIYQLDTESKRKSIKNFIAELAESKFVFCPRGVGSSSFRLYETLLAGSVPIVVDMIQFPFEEEVNWDDFVIKGSSTEIHSLIEKAKVMSQEKYEEMRKIGKKYVEELFNQKSLNDKLIKSVEKYLGNE